MGLSRRPFEPCSSAKNSSGQSGQSMQVADPQGERKAGRKERQERTFGWRVSVVVVGSGLVSVCCRRRGGSG